jgi:hypothetical protein
MEASRRLAGVLTAGARIKKGTSSSTAVALARHTTTQRRRKEPRREDKVRLKSLHTRYLWGRTCSLRESLSSSRPTCAPVLTGMPAQADPGIRRSRTLGNSRGRRPMLQSRLRHQWSRNRLFSQPFPTCRGICFGHRKTTPVEFKSTGGCVRMTRHLRHHFLTRRDELGAGTLLRLIRAEE